MFAIASPEAEAFSRLMASNLKQLMMKICSHAQFEISPSQAIDDCVELGINCYHLRVTVAFLENKLPDAHTWEIVLDWNGFREAHEVSAMLTTSPAIKLSYLMPKDLPIQTICKQLQAQLSDLFEAVSTQLGDVQSDFLWPYFIDFLKFFLPCRTGDRILFTCRGKPAEELPTTREPTLTRLLEMALTLKHDA